MTITPNALFHADWVEVISRIDTESIDLVYLDPPPAPRSGGHRTFSDGVKEKPSYEYLQFISTVSQQTHRVLKRVGAVFFHTQPWFAFSARLILNQVFGEDNFRNEFVWQYEKRAPFHHDTILHYVKTEVLTENPLYRPLTNDEVKGRFTKSDSRGSFTLADLTAPASRPNLQFKWGGVMPPKGRSWRFSAETLRQLESDDRLYQDKKTVMPKLKIYLAENAGVDVGTVWTDIPSLSPASKENTRYALQKPLGVIERLLKKASNQGDIVLDPFCGSGTSIVASERYERKWIGCDTSKEAIEITTKRLIQEFDQIQNTSFTLGDGESVRRIQVKPASYRSIAVRIEDFNSVGSIKFILNHQVSIEETRHYEFKEIKSDGGAVASIVNTSDEYAVAFLNSEGGRIYWGIRDKDRTVVGVRLNYEDRDRVRRNVNAKLNQVEPRVDPSQYRVEIHEVRDEYGDKVPDLCVVELVVPAANSADPYFTGSGEVWIKMDGTKQKLKGPALTDFIRRKMANRERSH